MAKFVKGDKSFTTTDEVIIRALINEGFTEEVETKEEPPKPKAKKK